MEMNLVHETIKDQMKIRSVAINPKILLAGWIYIGWFGCVYFGKIGWELGTLVFPLVAWTLLNLSFPVRQLLGRLSILFLVGLLFDSAAAYFGLIQLTPPASLGWLPLWMISLWLLFTASLPLLRNLLQGKILSAAILGAIFGPLSYRAGAQFGTLFLDGTMALLIYAAFWAIYIPGAVFWLGRKDSRSENS